MSGMPAWCMIPSWARVSARTASSRVKAAEGPWVTNSYNACGYRTPQSCGPKPAGDVRIAVLGSSIAQGYLVPYQETFAARAAEQLTHRCGEPVEFQNLASIGYVWERLARRADEALTLHPDAAIIVLIPFDLQQTDPGEDDGPGPKLAPEGPMKRLDSLMKNSRALVAAQHYLFSRPDLYTAVLFTLRRPSGLSAGAADAGMAAPGGRFRHLCWVGSPTKYHAAHVPLMLVYVPQRAQATLLAAHQAPPGVAPYAFGRRIGEIAARHGVDYLDLRYGFQPDTTGGQPVLPGRWPSHGQGRRGPGRAAQPRPCSKRCRRSPPAHRPISWSGITRHERSVSRISRVSAPSSRCC